MTEIVQNAGVLFVGFFALIMLLMGALLISLGLFTLQRSDLGQIFTYDIALCPSLEERYGESYASI